MLSQIKSQYYFDQYFNSDHPLLVLESQIPQDLLQYINRNNQSTDCDTYSLFGLVQIQEDKQNILSIGNSRLTMSGHYIILEGIFQYSECHFQGENMQDKPQDKTSQNMINKSKIETQERQRIIINIENAYLEFIRDANLLRNNNSCSNIQGFVLRKLSQKIKFLFQSRDSIENQEKNQQSNFSKREITEINYQEKDYKQQLVEVLELWCIQNFQSRDFEFLELLGSGSTGQVHLVRDAYNIKDFNKFALKQVQKSKIETCLQEQIISELKINRLLSSQNGNKSKSNSVLMYKVFENPEAVFIQLEYMSGGNLLDYIKHAGEISEILSKHIIKQLLESLKSIQQLNIVHKDLKLENVLLTGKTRITYLNQSKSHKIRVPIVKLADFGLSSVLSVGQDTLKLQLRSGTPGYMAPEIFQSNLITRNSDLFSVGCIMYSLITGKSLFNGKNVQEILIKNKNIIGVKKNLEFLQSKISQEAIDFIGNILQEDFSTRLSVDAALNHPWINLVKKSNHINKQTLFKSEQQTRDQKQSIDYCGLANSNEQFFMFNKNIQQSKNLLILNLSKNKGEQRQEYQIEVNELEEHPKDFEWRSNHQYIQIDRNSACSKNINNKNQQQIQIKNMCNENKSKSYHKSYRNSSSSIKSLESSDLNSMTETESEELNKNEIYNQDYKPMHLKQVNRELKPYISIGSCWLQTRKISNLNEINNKQNGEFEQNSYQSSNFKYFLRQNPNHYLIKKILRSDQDKSKEREDSNQIQHSKFELTDQKERTMGQIPFGISKQISKRLLRQKRFIIRKQNSNPLPTIQTQN